MRKLTLLAAIAVAVAVAGTAVAAFPQDNVKLYTGCLTNGGTLTYVAEGDSPLQPCSSPKQVVKLSGGDITSVNTPAGSGLSGGSTNGAVTLSLDAAHSLPTSCTTDQVPKSNGSNAWNCGDDKDTTYSAGVGLNLSAGNEFSIRPAYRIPGKACSTSGEFATGFDSTGAIQCAAPASSGGVQAYSAHVGATILAGETTVISKTVPAGTYLLVASVELQNQDGTGDDGFSIGKCSIPGYSTSQNVVRVQPGQVNGSDSLSLSSVIDHPGGAIELKCTELEADIDVFDATLTAIKLDSAG